MTRDDPSFTRLSDDQLLATAKCLAMAERHADGSRHIPAAVKREVWRRDKGQCAFAGRLGRCAETAFLEYHHVRPHAVGGEPTAANIELRCRTHNAYEATLFFLCDAPEHQPRREKPG